MKGVYVAFAVVTLAYFSVACAGYAAFGNEVNADVLLSVSNPPALIAIANFMVVVHIGASYQVRCIILLAVTDVLLGSHKVARYQASPVVAACMHCSISKYSISCLLAVLSNSWFTNFHVSRGADVFAKHAQQSCNSRTTI